jgi:hypothetical protein
MNQKQSSIAAQMLVDRRLPLEYSEIIAIAVLESRSPTELEISDEQLEILAQYVPELVCQFRNAGCSVGLHGSMKALNMSLVF